MRGIWLEDVEADTPGKRTYLETRLYSRTLADDVKLVRRHQAGRRARSSGTTSWTPSATTPRSPGSGCARR